MIKTKCVEQRAKAYADNNEVVMMTSGREEISVIVTDYQLNAKLTIRFPSVGDWNKHLDTMRKNPVSYLHINPKISNATSAVLSLPGGLHPESSLKESMRKLFEQAPTDGDVTFIVGKQKQRILAHELVVRMATPRYDDADEFLHCCCFSLHGHSSSSSSSGNNNRNNNFFLTQGFFYPRLQGKHYQRGRRLAYPCGSIQDTAPVLLHPFRWRHGPCQARGSPSGSG